MMAGDTYARTTDGQVGGPGAWSAPRPTQTSRYALRAAALEEDQAPLHWIPPSHKESWWPKKKSMSDCTVPQLKRQLEGQRKLLSNRAMMAALPDNGAKIEARCAALEEAIAQAEAHTQAPDSAGHEAQSDATSHTTHTDDTSQRPATGSTGPSTAMSALFAPTLTVTERPVKTPGAYRAMPSDSVGASQGVPRVGGGESEGLGLDSSSGSRGHGDMMEHEPGMATVRTTLEASKPEDKTQQPQGVSIGPDGRTTQGSTESNKGAGTSLELDEITGLLNGMSIAGPRSERIMHTVLHGTVAPKLKDWEDPKKAVPRTTMISVAEAMKIEHKYRARQRSAELERAATMMQWRQSHPQGSAAFGSDESKACVERLLQGGMARTADEGNAVDAAEEVERQRMQEEVEAATCEEDE